MYVCMYVGAERNAYTKTRHPPRRTPPPPTQFPKISDLLQLSTTQAKKKKKTKMSYYSIDAILTDAQKVPCTFTLPIPGLGHLEENPGGDVYTYTPSPSPLPPHQSGT